MIEKQEEEITNVDSDSTSEKDEVIDQAQQAMDSLFVDLTISDETAICDEGEWYTWKTGECYKIAPAQSLTGYNAFLNEFNFNLMTFELDGKMSSHIACHSIVASLFFNNPDFVYKHILKDWKNIKVDGKELKRNPTNFNYLVKNHSMLLHSLAFICVNGCPKLKQKADATEEKKI